MLTSMLMWGDIRPVYVIVAEVAQSVQQQEQQGGRLQFNLI